MLCLSMQSGCERVLEGSSPVMGYSMSLHRSWDLYGTVHIAIYPISDIAVSARQVCKLPELDNLHKHATAATLQRCRSYDIQPQQADQMLLGCASAVAHFAQPPVWAGQCTLQGSRYEVPCNISYFPPTFVGVQRSNFNVGRRQEGLLCVGNGVTRCPLIQGSMDDGCKGHAQASSVGPCINIKIW